MASQCGGHTVSVPSIERGAAAVSLAAAAHTMPCPEQRRAVHRRAEQRRAEQRRADQRRAVRRRPGCTAVRPPPRAAATSPVNVDGCLS